MLKEMLGDAYRPEMTHEELDAALSAAGITFDGNELERLKKALSKSNSEAAEYKRQLRAKLSDDEAKALPTGAVSLDPMRAQPPAPPGPAEPPAQSPAAEPASATAAPQTTAETPVAATKVVAKGKAAKSGDKA